MPAASDADTDAAPITGAGLADGASGAAAAAGEAATSFDDRVAGYEPDILQKTSTPFDVTVTDFRYVKDALISGTAQVTNNTVATVENAYIELKLEYDLYGVRSTYTQYAYASKLGIPPGGSRSVSYAALPPTTGDGTYRLLGAGIAAFDTVIDGAPKKVFVDTQNELLEILSDDI